MKRCFALVTIFAVFSSASVVQAADAKSLPLTKSEAELVALSEELYATYDKYYTRAEKITDEKEKEKFLADNDPSAKYVDRLVEFERTHHGTHAGLMAARRLVLLGAGGGDIGNPRDIGRRHALMALKDYANAAELPEIIRYLYGGETSSQSPNLFCGI